MDNTNNNSQEPKTESGKWPLIGGGSEGLRLATALKLARHGFGIIAVHRDRKSDQQAIETEFDKIRSSGLPFMNFKADAILPSSRVEIIQAINRSLPKGEKISLVVQSITLEFARDGIKANCILAGKTDTESFRRIPNSKKITAVAIRRNQNQRLTKPEDIADVVYLMRRKEAKWITSTVVKVGGGESLT
jgi:NAD(P)-dependent dehydrogenase (short-subunit alcohol dehydrogenase family)